MAATDVEICNLALDIVSVTNKVSNIAAPTTKEERACARWYATVRDGVLRRFPWPFAKRAVELVEITTETHSEWAFLYETPADWLKSRRVFVPGQIRNDRVQIPFQTFLNEAGTAYIIGADLGGLLLEYTKKFDTNGLVALMPPNFVMAVAAKLSEKIVKPLSLDAALIKEARDLFAAEVAEAFADDTETQQFDEPPDPEWLGGRG